MCVRARTQPRISAATPALDFGCAAQSPRAAARAATCHFPRGKTVHELSAPRIPHRALSGALVLALAACGGESTGTPGPVYPYDLVFERREGPAGAPDLYYLDLETGDAVRALAAGLGGMHPSSPPTGAQVAFVRTDDEFNSEVFVATWNSTTRQLSGLTNVSNHAEGDAMPALSPNGQRIAFVTDRAGFHDIFIANVDGTNVQRLTPADPSPAVTTEWWPAWSPNGQLVAYSSTIDGTPDIWTITVDATPTVRARRTGTVDSDMYPTWSPSGDRIAFQRIDANTGDADIVVLTVATNAVQKISMPGQQLWPAWSPDPTNELIAFSSNHEGEDFELYTMRPDGSSVVRRTDNGMNDLRATWILRAVQ